MDFDDIESLNEEELNELYDTGLYDMDGERQGCCFCGVGSGHMAFGNRVYGGCRLMQDEGLYDAPACRAWCRSRGETWYFYTEYCACLRYGQQGGTYGSVDRCTNE